MGSKPDRITKREIAERQLDRALKLLTGDGENYDPLSAVTLAGAAEEILGRMVQAKGMVTAFEESEYAAKNLWSFLISLDDEKYASNNIPEGKELRSRLNRVRNELKHNDPGTDASIDAHFWYEAEEMILRALTNYKKLFNDLPPIKEIHDWWDDLSL